MFPHSKDLIGKWAGFIVHRGGPTQLMAEIDKIQDDDSLHGTFSFPPGSAEMGGEFTADLYGPWLFVRLSDQYHGKMHFHLHIMGEKKPSMMFGALNSAKHRVPQATITIFKDVVFPAEVPLLLGAWQDFLKEGL